MNSEPKSDLSSRITFSTESNPDCISFCKATNYEDLYAVSYYEQEGTDQKWSGGFEIYSLEYDNDKKCITKNSLFAKKNNLSGIFDIKWMQSDSNDSLKLVGGSVNKTVQFFDINYESIQAKKNDTLEGHIDLNEKSCMHEVTLAEKALYLDVCDLSKKIAVACDNGIVSVVDTDKLCETLSYTAHDYSVWCSMFDSSNKNVIYSGADDANFCAYDTLSDTKIFKKKVSKEDGGICHIISNECDLSQNTIF